MPAVSARRLAARRAAERYRQLTANRRAAEAQRELSNMRIKTHFTDLEWSLALPIADTDEILEGLDR